MTSKPDKRVRVTVEVDNSFLRLLSAQIQLDGRLHRHVTGEPEGQLTARDVLAILICAEARGAHEVEVDAIVPYEWRPHVDIIHEERRVIERGEAA